MNKKYQFEGQDINGKWYRGLLSKSFGLFGQPEKGMYISNSNGMPWAYHIRPETIKFCINKNQEKIQCAAIHYQNNKEYPHQPKNIKQGIVLCGLRHCNCVVILYTLFPNKEYSGKCIQGFLTSKNNFVDRSQAAEIAFKADQIKIEVSMLFSEDLY